MFKTALTRLIILLLVTLLIAPLNTFAQTPEVIRDIEPAFDPLRFTSGPVELNGKMIGRVDFPEFGGEPGILDVATGQMSLRTL
jgi:hypothetical protein